MSQKEIQQATQLSIEKTNSKGWPYEVWQTDFMRDSEEDEWEVQYKVSHCHYENKHLAQIACKRFEEVYKKQGYNILKEV